MKIVEDRRGIIYKITFTNGKVYVGQTKRSLSQRGVEHIRETSGCVKLKNAFKKYGHEDCVMSVLKDNIPEIYLDFWENKFIDEYDSISSGYNIKYNTNFAIPTDIGMEYVPAEPKPNPFAKFANKEYTPPRQKIQVLLPKIPKKNMRGNTLVMAR
ncbi:GIY-YIG catalytic domain-containing endonuclease [Acanthocystis turfacea Chlorella virus Br0604L]|nr:GIY-YIG catalytic domain-containing endonuclease [Acanthocystis turfacea Chlorella virus Br0604L]AGE53680.1 GIY-YIG catalytic domain-containing endonuclease [Acanthocystis turfacea Chlorella virus GM0701.1]